MHPATRLMAALIKFTFDGAPGLPTRGPPPGPAPLRRRPLMQPLSMHWPAHLTFDTARPLPSRIKGPLRFLLTMQPPPFATSLIDAAPFDAQARAFDL